MSTIFRVEKTANFTVMSNIHLKDRRLSYKSKGLLSVILSLPPDWDYTVTGLACIASDGVESVKTAIRELERYGYITRRQTRDERGRMSVNEYRVYENPDENPDFVSCEAAESEDFSRAPQADKPLSEKPPTVKKSAASIKKLNKNKIITDKSNPSINRAARGDMIDVIDNSHDKKPVFSAAEREYFQNIIRENIGYSYYQSERDICKLQQIDEFVSIMTDAVCSNRPTIRVNGEDIAQDVVKSRFLSLDNEHIDYVLSSMKNAGEIINPRAYLTTALYNAPATISNFYSAMAYNDMRVGRI